MKEQYLIKKFGTNEYLCVDEDGMYFFSVSSHPELVIFENELEAIRYLLNRNGSFVIEKIYVV